jgi:polygalacturonase
MSTYLKLSVTRRAFLKGALATGAASYLSPIPFATAAVDPWRTADEIVSSIQPPKIPQRAFPITRFGARSDGVTDSTAAIAAAIEACHAAGGGRVLVPEGVFLTGAIRLKSRVNLHLVAGSTLKFSTDPRKYPNVLTRWEGNDLFNYSPLVYASHEKDIAITGEGTLDGQAGTFPNEQGNPSAWWWWKGGSGNNPLFGCSPPSSDPDKTRNFPCLPNQVADSTKLKQQGAVPRPLGTAVTPIEQRVYGIEPNGTQHYLRPPLIGPYGCENVLIEGVTLLRSPFWQMHPVFCKSVIIRGVTASSLGTNNDGCDPESCVNVLIEDCTFDTGDDCIAIKAGRGYDAMIDNGIRSRLDALPPWIDFPTTCQNIVIRNCEMVSGHGGVTLGSEMSGGVNNVFAENIDMLSDTLDIALRFKTNTWRGGFMTNYYARNISVPNGVSASNGVITIDYFYSADATDRPQDAGPFQPFTDNINMQNVNVPGGNSKWAFNLRGLSTSNTPCGTTTACTAGPGSKQLNDPIGRVFISDSTFKVTTATTSTFPFGDQIEAVTALALKNVMRNGTVLPDGVYSKP